MPWAITEDTYVQAFEEVDEMVDAFKTGVSAKTGKKIMVPRIVLGQPVFVKSAELVYWTGKGWSINANEAVAFSTQTGAQIVVDSGLLGSRKFSVVQI